MPSLFQGTAVALVTPFKKNTVDENCLYSLIERQIKSGTDAICILGTTGEASTVDEAERVLVIRTALAARNAFSPKNTDGSYTVKLVCGCGHNDTKIAIGHAILAEKEGADGLLAVTPYYNKCTQKGLIAYYEALMKASALPLIAYDVPARTGVSILPNTAKRLSELPRFYGIKDACGDVQKTLYTLRSIDGKCDTYCGVDALNFPFLCIGGAGVVSVVANLAPRLIKKTYLSVKSGDIKTAAKIDALLAPLVKACFSEINPIPVKAALSLLGYPCGKPRAPLTPLSAYRKQALKNTLESVAFKSQREGFTDGRSL